MVEIMPSSIPLSREFGSGILRAFSPLRSPASLPTFKPPSRTSRRERVSSARSTVIRKRIEHAADRRSLSDLGAFYIVRLSANTLIY